jgi:isoleucyl-tRNA synthetase
MAGSANPGLDMNYNFEDLEAKFRNLLVFWNMHKYALEMTQSGDIVPEEELSSESLGTEERYLLSRLNTAVRKSTESFDRYRLNEVHIPVEEFLLDMSRTYIQLVRDKASAGTDEEKTVVASALLHALRESAILLAPITPFFAEALYQNIKSAHPQLCKEESVHLCAWPVANEEMINEQLETDFLIAKDTIAAILAAREKAQLGVRWPVKEVRIECTPAQQEALSRMTPLISLQTNIKELSFEAVDLDFEISPNSKTIGKEFGKDTQAVMALITAHSGALAQMLKERKDHIVIDNKTLKEQHLNITRKVPDNYQMGEGNLLYAYLNTTRTPELEREGYAREIIRRIQQLRKNEGLVKSDRITVEITAADALLHDAIEEHQASIAERTGASRLQLVDTLSQGLSSVSTEKVKGISFAVGFSISS